MLESFKIILKEKFPGHADHLSATSIGNVYELFKAIISADTTKDDENFTRYSIMWQTEINNIKKELGFISYPEIYEEDKVAEKNKVAIIEKRNKIAKQHVT